MPYTTTGVFGKSSNVGTLMLAQRIGPERFFDMLQKFGLGQRTGVGLPGESAGLVPPIDQWSGSTFSNLPIGQGLSMTLLQMTGHVPDDRQRRGADPAADHQGHDRPRRHPHRRAAARRCPGGVAADRADGAQHVPRHRAEGPDGLSAGHRLGRGVEGYQIAGKTGTAQQINPACGCYSTTSTGSPSPGWPPSTIRATSSAS